jgi:hypothetical protein
MKHSWLLFAGVGAAIGFSTPLPAAAIRLSARVIDDATGQPLAARVAITNPDGRFIDIDGEHPHVRYLDKRWCYVDGAFALNLPDSGVQIEIRRGLETRPLEVTLAPDTNSATIEKTFRLRRWIDMRQQGWWNGDFHAHLPIPKEAHLQMRAEDLNALNLLHVMDAQNPCPINDCFLGRLDPVSTSACEIRVGQEVRDWQMGHLTLVNLTNLVSGYPDVGGTLEYYRGGPQWDLVRAMRACREQGGIIFWSHFASLPGAQSPIGMALGLVDGIELINWNDPTQLPNHWSPWQNSGMSQAEFPVLRPLDLYYQYLNAGFQVPIAAGTDKFFEEIPLGSNRVYARMREPATYAAWVDSIKAGKAFVSNGPILEFDAGGHESGDVVQFHGTNRFKARVTAHSILPFTTLEIVVNGQIVAHKTVPVPKNPAIDGLYSMEVETTVELARSAWLAARVAEHPDLRSHILPRGVSVFAHTAPIYFLQDNRKVRDEASIAYLCKYVRGVLHWLGTNPPFMNAADRQNARRTAEEALRVYQAL